MLCVPTVDTIDAPKPLLAPVLLTTTPCCEPFIPLVVMLCAPFVLVIVVDVAGPWASTSTYWAAMVWPVVALRPADAVELPPARDCTVRPPVTLTDCVVPALTNA